MVTANTNWFASPGVMDQRTYVDLYDKAMDVVWDRGNRVTPQLAEFFEKVNASNLTWKTSSVSSVVDLPIKSEDGAGVPYTQPVQGFDIEFTAVNYRRAIRVTEDLASLDRFGKVKMMMGGLVKSALRLKEYAYASIFDGAFASTVVADGMYLVDTGHPYEDPAAGTWDNAETTAALTATAFSTARVNMRKRKNEKGFPDPVRPAVLLTVPALEEVAYKILNAELQPSTALNDPNWNRQAVRVVISDWISTASTNPWFLIGDLTGEARGLFDIERVAANLKPVTQEDPDVIWAQRLKMAFTVGAAHARNIQGNLGTA